MAVSFVAAAGGDSGTASALNTSSVAIPAGVQAGDVALIVATAERVLLPTINWPTGANLTVAQSLAGTTVMASTMGWARVVAGDLSGSFSASVTANRRVSVAAAFFGGAADPVFTNGAFVDDATSAAQTAEHPNVTPPAADCMLVSLMSAISNISPFARSFSSEGTWTERAEYGSQFATGSNAFSYIASKLLSGGSGVAQTGNVVTEATARFNYFPTTVVLRPATSTDVPAGWDEVRLFRVA